mgnify:CR=1 FL=1
MTIDCSDHVFQLYEVLRDVATGTSYRNSDVILKFTESRSALFKLIDRLDLIPSFVIEYRDLPGFWGFIKEVSPTYEGRRKFLAAEFKSLLKYCEGSTVSSPLYSIFNKENENFDSYIIELWKKCIRRLELDPEGAITTARTLVEATCKHILDHYDVSYEPEIKLNQLYKETSKLLDLAPSKSTEDAFKQLMSGLFTIVNAVSAIRNKVSDSHAIESKLDRPDPRHALLCVTISGAVSEFLLTTFYDQIPF